MIHSFSVILRVESCTISCCQDNFMIIVKFTKIFDHRIWSYTVLISFVSIVLTCNLKLVEMKVIKLFIKLCNMGLNIDALFVLKE